MIFFPAMPRTKGDAKQGPASREDAIDCPLEYLSTSSNASIESFHLSRLNAMANLRKELHEIVEEWVEAEVQARLAQWLLARNNPEQSADASLITIDSVDSRSTWPVASPSVAARSSAHSLTRTVTTGSPPPSDIADCGVRPSDNSNNSSITFGTGASAAASTYRASRATAAQPRNRSPITRSAIACRPPRFPAFNDADAIRNSPIISKPGKVTRTLLSFRRANRNRAAG